MLMQVLHNCVGRGNMRYFTLYTASLLGGQLLFLWLAAAFLATPETPGAVGVGAAWATIAAHPGIVLLGLLQVRDAFCFCCCMYATAQEEPTWLIRSGS
jgi:hypothetical protein